MNPPTYTHAPFFFRPFLQEQYSKATAKLEETRVNNEFLREQIITTEVNIARIYNYGVKLRRQEKAKALAAAGK